MRQVKSIYISLLVIFLSFNAYSQYGVIVMNNGEELEMGGPDLSVEDDQLRYYTEEFNEKPLLAGVSYKKQKKEYLEKSRLIKISDIKNIHAQGEFSIGSRSIAKFIGIRYVKGKKRYQKYYVIEDGECSLLLMPQNSNALYSYYAQKGNEEPYELHRSGTGTGPKYKKRSKKYFADCEPAMKYIKNGLKKTTLPKLVKIYNSKCAY